MLLSSWCHGFDAWSQTASYLIVPTAAMSDRDINSMRWGNALAPYIRNSVPWTVKTSRQRSSNQRVGYLQWLGSRACGPAKRSWPGLLSTVPTPPPPLRYKLYTIIMICYYLFHKLLRQESVVFDPLFLINSIFLKSLKVFLRVNFWHSLFPFARRIPSKVFLVTPFLYHSELVS